MKTTFTHHDPDYNNDCDEPTKVERNSCALEKWKLTDHDGIKQDGTESECNRKQRSMPAVIHVIGLAHRDEGHDLLGADECCCG